MTHPPQQPLALIEKLRSRIEQAFGSWTWRHGAAPNAKDDADAADTLERQAQEIQRLREGYGELEQRATATLAAMDSYNEKNGTYIIGPSLLQLGKSVAKARNLLSSQENSDDR